MDAERVFTVVVGLILLAGVGMTATTLQSSVETTPEDAIDVDTGSLPIGSDEIGKYDGAFDDSGGGTSAGGSGEPQGDGTGGSDGDRADSESSSRNEEQSGANPQSGDGSEQSQSGDGPNTGKGEPDQSLLEWLLSLLRALLAFLLRLLPLIVVFGLLAGAVAARDRIAEALQGFVGEDGDGDGDGGSRFRAAPTNEVAQAWYEMAALVDADVAETESPRQCATRAVEAGADRSAVDRVTTAFEEVRYGHAPVTDDRRRRAHEGLDTVRSQLGVDR